jgi:hypothetical protein
MARRRTVSKPRQRRDRPVRSFTIGTDVDRELREYAERHGISYSRAADALMRKGLGMPMAA